MRVSGLQIFCLGDLYIDIIKVFLNIFLNSFFILLMLLQLFLVSLAYLYKATKVEN